MVYPKSVLSIETVVLLQTAENLLLKMDAFANILTLPELNFRLPCKASYLAEPSYSFPIGRESHIHYAAYCCNWPHLSTSSGSRRVFASLIRSLSIEINLS